MILGEAYNAGKHIKEILLNRGDRLEPIIEKLQKCKNDKYILSYKYLEICIHYRIHNNNNFIIEMLNSTLSSKDIAISLIAGILNEDNEFISLIEASKIYNLNSSTLRNRIRRGGFEKEEIEKRGRDWWISKQAMKRIYGKN